MGRLDGKIAVITGGAMGMGNGSATALAKEGAKVNIIDISDEGYAAVEELRKYDPDASFYKVDVSDLAAMREAYDDVAAKYGRIDIAVNVAGIGTSEPFLKVSEETLERIFKINYKGMWNACKAAIPHMLPNKYGKIVNFSSVTGITVCDPGMTTYSSTKGAIMGLTKSLASEFASSGITVNAVLPGIALTPMLIKDFKASAGDDWMSVADSVAATIPMGRIGTIEEAGRLVLFLTTEESSYVTGQGIVFDGGSGLRESMSDWEIASEEE